MQKFSIILAKKPKPETEASPSGEVQTADKPHGGVFRKVFARLFQKAAPIQGA
jgi:hypothetical protein